MYLIKIIFCFFILVIPNDVFAQSFDCSKASTVVETAICEDTELSKLDEQMSEKYVYIKQNLKSNEEKREFINNQIDWIKIRQQNCKDDLMNKQNTKKCLLKNYQERIQYFLNYSPKETNSNKKIIEIDDSKIIEKACVVEKYLGNLEYASCIDKQKNQIKNTEEIKLRLLEMPENQLHLAKEKCINQENSGIEDYYNCLYTELKIDATFNQAPDEIASKVIDTFIWKSWNPLPNTLIKSQSAIEKSPSDIYDEVSKSVYTIIAAPTIEHMKNKEKVVLGSGVAITNSLAITNCHVLEGNNFIVLTQADYLEEAVLVSSNKELDKCIITTSKATLNEVKNIRGYRHLNVGDKVYAIGSPNSLQNTLSEGIISGLRGDNNVGLIQTSAAISHGSSGGGLFDSSGNLIGITTFMLKDAQALNFAIAVDEFFAK